MDDPGSHILKRTYLAAASTVAVVVCKTLAFNE